MKDEANERKREGKKGRGSREDERINKKRAEMTEKDLKRVLKSRKATKDVAR